MKGLGEAFSCLCPSIVIQENLKFSVQLINLMHLNENQSKKQIFYIWFVSSAIKHRGRMHFSSTWGKFQIQQFHIHIREAFLQMHDNFTIVNWVGNSHITRRAITLCNPQFTCAANATTSFFPLIYPLYLWSTPFKNNSII